MSDDMKLTLEEPQQDAIQAAEKEAPATEPIWAALKPGDEWDVTEPYARHCVVRIKRGNRAMVDSSIRLLQRQGKREVPTDMRWQEIWELIEVTEREYAVRFQPDRKLPPPSSQDEYSQRRMRYIGVAEEKGRTQYQQNTTPLVGKRVLGYKVKDGADAVPTETDGERPRKGRNQRKRKGAQQEVAAAE